ncbi:roadblock/LC7 domain-containing protein [Streptomyces sp. NPDC095613]|uniref:roadblock/LC7 domain-containing protein n=1 Tax=Streptomyces sp. NPDC095613 TaxID=3155540 RepID=UPI0033338331
MSVRSDNDVFTIQAPGHLDWLLEDFVGRVPGASSAVLASGDGLRLAVHGLDEVQRDHLSAIVTGLVSLARGVGEVAHEPHGGRVRQVVVEHDAALLFVAAAGQSTVLGVLADRDADAGIVGHEMTTLVASVADHLGTAVRTTP